MARFAGSLGNGPAHCLSRIPRTVASSSLTLIGFPWKPSNPAAMMRVRSWVITEAVMAMTGVGLVTGISPQPIQGFDAADAGQLDVHEDERRLSLVREADALFAGLGLDGLITLDLQRVAHQLQVLGVVFNDEDELIRHDAPES
jgi:hypothetical protein